VWTFEEDVIRMAVIYTGGKKPAVVEAHTEPFSAETDEQFESAVGAVHSLSKAMKAKPAAHVLMADSRQSVARLLAVPFRGKRRVAAAVTFELEPHLAVPVDELTVDHIFVREVDDESEVLALGLRTQELAEQVAILNAAGVSVDGIGLDVAGLTALLNQQRGKSPGLHAALHVSDQDALFTITQSKTLAYFRVMSCNAETIENDPNQAAREIQNTLRAFLATWRGATEVTDLTITGVNPSSEVRQQFESAIATPVTYTNLLDGIRDGNRLSSDASAQPFTAVAMTGAAMAAAGDGPEINFAQGELAGGSAIRRFTSQLVISGVLLAVLLCGFLLYSVTTYRQRIAEIDAIGDQIWDLYAQAFPTSPTIQSGRNVAADVGGIMSLKAMESDALNAAGRRGSVSLDVLTRPTLLALLEDISNSLPGDQVTITSVMVRASRNRSQEVVIMGDVSAQAVGAVNAMFDRLKESDHIHVTIDQPMRSIREEKATFTIMAST
jgi:hypothetical protein